jgi:uncharacterized protein
MRIAVIADTHDRVPNQLLASLAKADEIWHLGDVCDERVIQDFLALSKPLKVVRGNCDACCDWPLTLDLEREGLKIHLVHIPPREAPHGVDLLLHGHTHVPRDEMVDATRFLNPGTVSKPNHGSPPSFAWLELERDKPVLWRIELLWRA